MIFHRKVCGWFILLLATPLIAQQPPAPVAPAAAQAPNATAQAPNPAPQPPAAPATTAAQQPPPVVYGGLSLNNASLTEVIDLLARQLKINYILDPSVKGGVILNTYGETKDIDTRSLLETILRINGYGMVKQGELYRIVPLAQISHLPLAIETKTDGTTIPEDDQTMLNLVFLKYVTADELTNVLKPFIGENASIYTYAPANLLLILDSRRNMRRVMDLVAMFDSDQLANQRVRVFEVKNGRPTDLAKELDTIVKSISLSEKSAPIRFLPIDRINTIIAVAPNPGAFAEVETWLAKLDTPVRASVGGVNNYVYRVRYGDANSIACSIQALYGQLYSPGNNNPGSVMACMAMNQPLSNGPNNIAAGGIPNGFGALGGGMGYGGGAYGGGAYGGGAYGANPYAYGANPYAAGYGAGAYNPAAYNQTPYLSPTSAPIAPGAAPATPTTPAGATSAGTDLTGTYLGAAPVGVPLRVPRVVANPMNNTLLIQATPQEYDNIERLLRDLDVPPRQVLIEAKIYSIDLTHQFGAGVQSAQLQALSGTTSRSLLGSLIGDTTTLTGSVLVGKSRELLATVQLEEQEQLAKVLSTPAVIATDSIPASISVGATVPTLAGSVASSLGGGVTNAVASASTGIGLNIVARVTPTGIVTMVINQNVSDPEQTTTSSIQSPSFSTQSIATQVTVQDGDTIAIGGMIAETTNVTNEGIPLLHRIPYIGALFGNRSYTKERTELIIFLTPHVIYDNNQLLDATDELRGRIKLLRKDIKD